MILDELFGEQYNKFYQFLNSDNQYAKWLKNLNDVEVASIVKYSQALAKTINVQLRRNKGKYWKMNFSIDLVINDSLLTAENIIDIIDNAINNYGGLTDNMMLYRAVDVGSFFKLGGIPKSFYDDLKNSKLSGNLDVVYASMKALEGMKISDYAYMSTSPGYNTSFASHADEYPIVLEILAPKGTPGAYINLLSYYYNKENEFLLARNTVLKIDEVSYYWYNDDKGIRRKKIFVRCIIDNVKK